MDLLNELQYNFSTKGARTGERQKDETGKYSPNLLDRMLGVGSDDLRRSAQQGELQRYNESSQGQKAAALGVDVTAADMGNKGALGLRVSDAEQGRTLSRQLRAIGGNPGDVKDPATLGSMISDQRRSNTRRDNSDAANDLYSSPQMVEERRVRDEATKTNESRYIDLQEQNRIDRATNDKRYLDDRADARDLRADELQMRRELYERQDLKEERNRRRDSIAALTSGLAALGAAFAL